MLEKNFDVNEFISLRLEKNQTNIYVNGEFFKQCKYLLINIPINEKNNILKGNSIDNFIFKKNEYSDGFPTELIYFIENDVKYDKYKYQIPPEIEFWAHCSNLQAWFEQNYDTRLLHSNLSFPLLEKLTELGDSIARKVFKEEIAKRFSSGYIPVMKYLVIEGYLKYLNYEEREIAIINLKIIDLSNCNLKKFPKIILKTKALLKLYLNDNKISTVPIKIKNLKDLKELDLSYNNLKYLPESFGILPSLESLNMSQNKIISLPDTFGKLKSIKFIDLRNNQIRYLPKSFGDLKKLETINLGINYLKKLPNSLKKLKNLYKIDLSLNMFDEFPKNICEVYSLVHLNLSNNNISIIPDQIINLYKLKHLDLSENNIISLPENIGYLNSLKTFCLSGNKIEKLPESISHLIHLENLFINNNNIAILPEFIFNLPSIKEITIDNRQKEKISKKLEEKIRKRKIKLFLAE